MSEQFKMLLGVSIFVATFALAAELSKLEEQARHERYLKCLEDGKKPIVCSFNSVFRRDY